MAQDWAKKFYKSPAWKKNSRNYMKLPLDGPDGLIPPGVCERCFSMGRMTPATLVHHRNHLTPENINDPHYTLAYSNLQRLCVDCHAFVHSGRTESRVTFDAEGNVVPIKESLEDMVIRLTEQPDRNIHRSKR